MFKDDENVKGAVEELDKHDLTGILTVCWESGITDPYYIGEQIQSEAIPKQYGLYKAIEELMEYLIHKYDVHFAEITEYRMLRPKFIKD